MSTATPNLSDEQLGELLGLIKGSDSVELKLTVPDSDHYAVAAALVGGTLLGVVGALLAIPGAATIQIALKEYLEYSRGKQLPASPAA